MFSHLQFHLLFNAGPGNFNRDKSGRPKTANLGGVTRQRWSSQSMCRPLTQALNAALDGGEGLQTRELINQTYDDLLAGGLSKKEVEKHCQRMKQIIDPVKEKDEENKKKEPEKKKKKEGFQLSETLKIHPEEERARRDLVKKILGKEPVTDEDFDIVRAGTGIVIAVTGRMFAKRPDLSVEAGLLRGHALSVHASTVEHDFFVACDDLNKSDIGTSHMGTTQFSSGLMYAYYSLNLGLTLKNLGGNKARLNALLKYLVQALPNTTPRGHITKMAHIAPASYVMVEKVQAPYSLFGAFTDPIDTERVSNILEASVLRLREHKDRFDTMYCRASDWRELSLLGPDQNGKSAQTIEDLVKFVTE